MNEEAALSWAAEMAARADEPLLPMIEDDVVVLESGWRMIRNPFYTGLLVNNGMANDEFKRNYERAISCFKDGDYAGFMLFVAKPWRLAILGDQMGGLWKPTTAQFLDQLPHVWAGSEPDDTEPEYVRLWRRAKRLNGGRPVTDGRLPRKATLTVYRGEQVPGSKRGCAWSTKSRVAEYFANRSGIDETALVPGIVFVGEVQRDDILGYVTCRNEFEVIAPPSKVKVIRTYTAPSPKVTAAKARKRWHKSLGEATKLVADLPPEKQVAALMMMAD